MLITSHTAVGSILSRPGRSVPSAFLLGLTSHIVMDSITHWGTLDKDTFIRVARADGTVGLVLLVSLLVKDPRAAHAAGLLGAILPDLEKPAIHFSGVRIFPPKISQWLADIQDESPDLLAREFAAAAFLSAAALAFKGSARSSARTKPRRKDGR